MRQTGLLGVVFLAFVLSGCGASQSVSPPVPPNALNMSITNGTSSVIAMSPQTQDDRCMLRVPPRRTLAPHQAWHGTIALDKNCPSNRWSFGVTFASPTLVGAGAEWSKGANGRWLLFYVTSQLQLKTEKGSGGLFDVTLVEHAPPR